MDTKELKEIVKEAIREEREERIQRPARSERRGRTPVQRAAERAERVAERASGAWVPRKDAVAYRDRVLQDEILESVNLDRFEVEEYEYNGVKTWRIRERIL